MLQKEKKTNALQKTLIDFFKKETVLSIAGILALVSALAVFPDKEYIGYIDFRTLGILFSLMVVMAGYQKLSVFHFLASSILRHTRNLRQVFLVLVLLCFFFSMIITNDVALITFVPLTLNVLHMEGEEVKKKWLIPLVAFQTVAANLGSMLTPIGNPQNLYLYGISGLTVVEFLGLMAPYTLISFVLLCIWCIVAGDSKKTDKSHMASETLKVGKEIVVYSLLFVGCLLVVGHVIPFWIMVIIVLVTVLFMDRKVLKNVDYSLLLTFVFFFVFIGNLGRIPAFRDMIMNALEGHEMLIAVLASQVISNVPAALLLSGFTDQYGQLILGTDIGGLGTLIASMASLISFKYIAKDNRDNRGRYLGYFTVVNILFLMVLLPAYYLLTR